MERAGLARLSVTDHLWRISSLICEEDEPMLEAYTVLARARTRSGRTRRSSSAPR